MLAPPYSSCGNSSGVVVGNEVVRAGSLVVVLARAVTEAQASTVHHSLHKTMRLVYFQRHKRDTRERLKQVVAGAMGVVCCPLYCSKVCVCSSGCFCNLPTTSTPFLPLYNTTTVFLIHHL